MNNKDSNKIFLKETFGGIMQKYGEAIRGIRKSRGMTQKYIGKGILSQAAFSKYERGLTDIHSSAFIQILERLGMSLEEFEYVYYGYSYPTTKKIFYKFFNFPYSRVEDLNELIIEIDACLLEQPIEDLVNIKRICNALICLNQEKDIQKARDYVEPIWIKLSKLDQWFYTDILFINAILYFFPNDVATEMAKNVLSKIENYKDFQDSNQLKITLKINLSLLLIKERDYHTTLNLLEDTLKMHKQSMSYQSLALIFNRIAICRKMLNIEKEVYYLDQATLLLKIYDQQVLLQQLIQEYEHYTNI
ncbi:helix-turn-helix domain-containing protein [Planomicrobium okeanokoites]|uniref:Helix-turn-helix domain-containing protein n=1 Tax=Planomicrobium okeanokoites TaxID=244 RepID=A0ABV7KMV1_PLAOK|nr:helix-turn-helix transcriptional regulator [Planomicrobium okeanokoites]TAA65735.1 XRE family transcriptional regulator [Planomicrobium okeanokoites]